MYHESPNAGDPLPKKRRQDMWINVSSPPRGSGPMPLSPLSSHSFNMSPLSSASPIWRRHAKRKSSTVFVPPIRNPVSQDMSSAHLGLPPTPLSPSTNRDRQKPDMRKPQLAGQPSEAADIAAVKTVPRSVLRATSFLVGANFLSKMLTFSLNQALLRFVDPRIVGINSQMELMISSILFFSREAIRLATQRQTLKNKKSDVYLFEGGVVHDTISGTIQETINMGFLSIYLGIAMSVSISYLYYLMTGTRDYGRIALAVYAVAAVVELLSEPAFLYYQLILDFKTRAWSESTAMFARCVVTFVLVLLVNEDIKLNGNRSMIIIAFALGQLAYACVLSCLYIVMSLRANRGERFKAYGLQKVIPAEAREGSQREQFYFETGIKKLASSIWLQTIFKHCLSEGDKFMVSLLLPLSDQGIYSVVGNYGSLIARLVFLPIEEALRNYISKILNGKTKKLQDWNHASSVLTAVMRGYVYLSFFAVVFGPLVTDYFLKFLMSSYWITGTNASKILAVYATYIPFMAMNGCLEAFVQSIISVDDIKRQSVIMGVFSLSFALTAFVLMSPNLLNLGAEGLIFANMLNMTMRVIWCIFYIEDYRKKTYNDVSTKPWKWFTSAGPSIYIVLMTIVSASAAWLYIGNVNTIHELVKLLTIAGFTFAFIGHQERNWIRGLVRPKTE